MDIAELKLNFNLFSCFVCKYNMCDVYLHPQLGRLAQLVQTIPILSEVVGITGLEKCWGD